MRGHFAILVALNFLLLSLPSLVVAQQEEPEWRSIGIDPETWSDGPVEEETPMKQTYQGNAIVAIEVSYVKAHFDSREEGVIVLELFEQWAPITTANMVKNVEAGIYDGIFFHRVIDDFVTQAGDPTCKEALPIYPSTSPECGSGGTGTTIPLEHNENLSHVDGAIGMARDTDPDSADSQWYIAETEAHNLDPENRDDEGYATFGVVRDGMQHIRNIAITPTTDDPTGEEIIVNPASSAGRPFYQAKIISVSMIGVSDPDGTIREGGGEEQEISTSSLAILSKPFILVGVVIILLLVFWVSKVDQPLLLTDETETPTLDAILFDEPEDPLGKDDDIVIFDENKI